MDHNPTSRLLLDDARQVLRAILANGPLPAADVKRQAAQAGLGPSQLWKAKVALRATSRKLGQPGQSAQSWACSLPAQEPPPPNILATQPKTSAPNT